MKTQILSAAFAALLCVGCAPVQAAQAPAPVEATVSETPTATPTQPAGAPALWRVADEDTTVWLFGTIHVLPTGFTWRNPVIDAAIAESDSLVLETVTSDDPSQAALLLMQLGMSPELPPIGERVDEELLPQLAAMIARGPFPESFLNALETWAASLMLVGVTLNDLGLDPESGVEEQLELIFELAERPVEGLETPAQQLGFFDALPEEAQRYFLNSVIDTPEDIREEFDAMLEAWRSGDEEQIAMTFDDELLFSDTLRETLLTRRNATWASWIVERLEEPGTVFVAVGAGHLAGEDTVQDFLENQGIVSERVQ